MSDSSNRARDNRANQLNPAHPAYYLSRGVSPEEAQRSVEQYRATREHALVEAPQAPSKSLPVKPT